MSTNTDKKAGLYFILTTATATEDSTTQAIATLNHEKPTLAAAGSIASGYSSVVVDFASGIADAASKTATGAEAKALGEIAEKLGNRAGLLGLAQVTFNTWDNYEQGKSWEELSAGELLNVAAAVTSMAPGLQIVGFALAGVSVAYSIYEEENGKITIGEIGEYWHTKMDDLVNKFKGDEFDEIKVNIGKSDAKLLDMLPENSLEQKAVMQQFDQWHTAQIASGEYKGERFFADNEDDLQYTTAQGEGFDVDGNASNQYVNDLLLNLSREINSPYFLWTSFAKDLQQWNIVTNKDGGNVSALDAEKTQFMLGSIGNDRLIGGNKDDVLIGRNGDDYLYGGKGSDQLYGGAGFDTYEFKTGEMNWDRIHDVNGDGQIIIDGVNFSSFQFTKKYNSDFIWEYKIGDNNWWAMLNDKDLTLMYDNNRIVIENYQSMGGNKLGIVLSDEETTQPETSDAPDYLLWTGDIRPNTKIIHKDGEDIDTGIYDVNWTDHSQRDENGFLINGEYQDGFNDVMVGQNGVSNYIYGLTGNDALSGGNGDDVIDGGDGDDLITGGGGADTIYGGSGDDNIYSNLTLRVPLRDSDNDKWTPSNSYFNIVTTAPTWGIYTKDKQGNRTIDIEHKTLHTDAIGQMGDRLYGGSGNDTVVGGNRNDVIYGDELDSINTQSTKDGDDSLYGLGGDDLIYGNGGNDVIFGDGKADNASKGIFQYSAISEHGNDIIYSGSGDDGVYGNAGDDVIFGEDGNDYLWGDFANSADTQKLADADGNDYIDGGLGNDQILGGGGDDYLMGDKGDDSIIGDYFTQELIEISGSDVIDGGDGNDQLIGGAGNDTLLGGNGNDKLWGDFDNTIGIDVVGNDYLDGGDGDDTLEGGAGDDILIAGKGKDGLLGGTGNDLYLFNSEDLQDGQNNQIVDKDGKGNILIDNVYLHQHNWRAIAPNIWRTDTMQLRKIIQDEHTFLLWQSQQHTSTIIVQDYQDGDLGINLPEFIPASNDDTNNGTENETIDDDSNNDSNNGSHNDPSTPVSINHAPNVQETLNPQTLTAHQNWTFRLPENLFTDPDGDTLTYHINNLPNWLTYNEQTQTLTGTPTIDDTGSLIYSP